VKRAQTITYVSGAVKSLIETAATRNPLSTLQAAYSPKTCRGGSACISSAMTIGDNRTSSANSTFGSHDRQDGPGAIRLAGRICHARIKTSHSLLFTKGRWRPVYTPNSTPGFGLITIFVF
jgi:hypothetical protein